MMHKFLFQFGKFLRNPSLNKTYAFLKESEIWSKTELEAYQLQKLQEILKTAYTHSQFYKALFDRNNIHPSDIKSLEDLSKIPTVEKQELIDNVSIIHTNLKFNKSFKANTSGSTGNPLEFLRDEKADSFNRASIFRGYSWYNVKPWERNGYFWGFDFSYFKKAKTRVFDAFQNRFRMFSFEQTEINSFVKKMNKAVYLHGYSSMIYEVAKSMNRLNLQLKKPLKMVKGTSEKIYESYHEEVEKAFGTKIISEYGAAETGIIAFECPNGSMHINMEGVIVEELDNEIVVTNLQMHSFPVLRYKLGDYITLSNEQCECGMKHSIIEEVTGRIGNVVYGTNLNYPNLYFYYIFKNLSSNHQINLTYQVIQTHKGYLEFKIEQKLDNKEMQMLSDEIEKYFKGDIEYNIDFGVNLGIKSSKRKSFISTIND